MIDKKTNEGLKYTTFDFLVGKTSFRTMKNDVIPSFLDPKHYISNPQYKLFGSL